MFEVWAKRKDTPVWEFITSFEDKNATYSILDLLNSDDYDEAIVLQDKKYVLMKIYEKGKVLRK